MPSLGLGPQVSGQEERSPEPQDHGRQWPGSWPPGPPLRLPWPHVSQGGSAAPPGRQEWMGACEGRWRISSPRGVTGGRGRERGRQEVCFGLSWKAAPLAGHAGQKVGSRGSHRSPSLPVLAPAPRHPPAWAGGVLDFTPLPQTFVVRIPMGQEVGAGAFVSLDGVWLWARLLRTGLEGSGPLSPSFPPPLSPPLPPFPPLLFQALLAIYANCVRLGLASAGPDANGATAPSGPVTCPTGTWQRGQVCLCWWGACPVWGGAAGVRIVGVEAVPPPPSSRRGGESVGFSL